MPHDCLISINPDGSRKEAFYGKELIIADRDMVETESDEILRNADKDDISLLVVGDPYGYADSPRLQLSELTRCLQRYNTHGHRPPRALAQHPDADHPQRVDHERGRRVRPAAVQLRTDSLARVLYRDVEAGQLLRPHQGERGPRDAHPRAPRYQG